MDEVTGDNSAQGEDVPVRPPNLFLGGLTVAALLELLFPLGPGLGQGNWKAWLIGLVIAGGGAALAAHAIRTFKAAHTGFRFEEETSALVTQGPYRVSRNPIYIGLITFYTGISIALTTGWALILLPVIVVILQTGVISREEAFMKQKFGEDYREYCKRVPRWL